MLLLTTFSYEARICTVSKSFCLGYKAALISKNKMFKDVKAEGLGGGREATVTDLWLPPLSRAAALEVDGVSTIYVRNIWKSPAYSTTS